MIIYLHGYDSTYSSNHEQIIQLKFIDDDVRFINYSTLHPKHDMQYLLNEVHKLVTQSNDPNPVIFGRGLGAFWAERVGFLCQIKQVLLNPNLFPHETMEGKIDRPEEYTDIASKCIDKFRDKNKDNAIVILSRHNEVFDSKRIEATLSPYYSIIWDEESPHRLQNLSCYLNDITQFKGLPFKLRSIESN